MCLNGAYEADLSTHEAHMYTHSRLLDGFELINGKERNVKKPKVFKISYKGCLGMREAKEPYTRTLMDAIINEDATDINLRDMIVSLAESIHNIHANKMCKFKLFS